MEESEKLEVLATRVIGTLYASCLWDGLGRGFGAVGGGAFFGLVPLAVFIIGTEL